MKINKLINIFFFFFLSSFIFAQNEEVAYYQVEKDITITISGKSIKLLKGEIYEVTNDNIFFLKGKTNFYAKKPSFLKKIKPSSHINYSQHEKDKYKLVTKQVKDSQYIYLIDEKLLSINGIRFATEEGEVSINENNSIQFDDFPQFFRFIIPNYQSIVLNLRDNKSIITIVIEQEQENNDPLTDKEDKEESKISKYIKEKIQNRLIYIISISFIILIIIGIYFYSKFLQKKIKHEYNQKIKSDHKPYPPESKS